MELQLALKQNQTVESAQKAASVQTDTDAEPAARPEPKEITRPEPEEPQPDTKEPLSEPGPEISEDASDGSDLLPEFDIMALLEEQLESYSEMGLEERMEEIDVVTMEISFEELAAFIKDKRKKRGA